MASSTPMVPPSVTLYGIASCDSCRKTRGWLTQHGVEVRYHDLRTDGVPPDHLRHWVEQIGWERVLNRRSTTWRKLDADARDAVRDADSAIALLLAHPTAIKRPVLEWSQGEPSVTVGHAPEDWQRRIGG